MINILTKPTILYYIAKYPSAAAALLNWYNQFLKVRFKNINELKRVYGNASLVANDRVIFNIKGNDYRLIVSMDYRRQSTYIIWFGTHKEYNKIDAATIPYEDID